MVKLILVSLLTAVAACAEDLPVPGGTIDLEFRDGTPSRELRGAVHRWIADSAKAVAAYYGHFPVRHAVFEISLVPGDDPGNGEASGWNGARITMTLGRNATAADFADEWMLPHEMLHLGFPDMAERHHWIEEGIASYVEPIARARTGMITPEKVWADLVEGLPQGQPKAGDRGLDRTATWGRTYWGGALFCVRADVEIRRRTGNKKGLEHALRAILEEGGNIEHGWKIERVIAVGDGATGVPVLRELYEEMALKPGKLDLPAFWKQLGVIPKGKTVAFDDSAPLAAIRRAITAK